MKCKRLKFLILPTVVFFTSIAEGKQITGTITDTEGKPIEFASIRVCDPDSVFIAGATTDEMGLYRIVNLVQDTVIIAAGCLGYTPSSRQVFLNDSIAVDFRLNPDETMLEELTVTADRFIRTKDGITVIPDKQQKRHAFSGYDLIRNLMIPGVTVDSDKGIISALGGNATIYVDGMEADQRDIRQLRPSDVEKVEYINVPSGRFAGNNTVVNFILKKREYGGYIEMDAKQRIGYQAGNYNFSSKYHDKNTQYSLYAGTDYHNTKDAVSEGNECILFPYKPVVRNYSSQSGIERRNAQYARFRVRNKNNVRTLRATFNFVRDAMPENIEFLTNDYQIPGSDIPKVISEKKEDSKSIKYSLGLSGTFKLPHSQTIDASTSATIADNRYNYSYSESSDKVVSQTNENLYNFNGNISYVKSFPRGNTLTAKATEVFNISSANYEGTNKSWQHLWMSESLFFIEYVHPLSNRASIFISSGMSLQAYRLHGKDKVVNISPRAQLMLTMQPGRSQSVQIGGVYGNSYPQLSMLNDATTQINMFHLKKGNPDLGQTHITNLLAAYGAGIGKVSLQAVVNFTKTWKLPMTYYRIENELLVQSFDGNGRWTQISPTLSITWMPASQFNLQISGEWLHNRYGGTARLSSSCWKGETSIACYFGSFAINVFASTPVKTVGYDRIETKTIWNHGISGSWSNGKLRIETCLCNPFYRHPFYISKLETPEYRFQDKTFSPADRQSIFIKAAYTFDFGKRIKHDILEIDRNINSGILRAR